LFRFGALLLSTEATLLEFAAPGLALEGSDVLAAAVALESAVEFLGALVLFAVFAASSAGVLLLVLAQPFNRNPRSNTDKVESLTERVICISVSVVCC
jgi:hypothetical protein